MHPIKDVLKQVAPNLPHDSPFLIHTIQANSGELIGAYELGKRTLTVRSEFNGAIVAVTLSGERGGAGDTVYLKRGEFERGKESPWIYLWG